jgi:FkbM family methyltransferase
MLIREAIQGFVPRSPWLRRLWKRHQQSRWLRRLWIRHQLHTGEPELRLVGHLLKEAGAVVDVGANAGIYSALALQRQRLVAAFEPVPEEAIRLRRLIGKRGVVHQVALSDRCGKAVLHVPYASDAAVTTRSSLEADVDVDLSHRDIEVNVATLDSFGLSDIAFIKIDVEGHELSVLRGATETIVRSRPNLLVEVEESRVPGCFQAVADFFSSLDYSGFWFDGAKMRSIKDFQPAVQQVNRPKSGEKSSREYINNFIWLPHGQRSAAWSALSDDIELV